MKNILITSIGVTKRMNEINYYHYNHSSGRRSYCAGISVAEAGTKFLLSRYKIDEIFVIGSEDAICELDRKEPTVLKNQPLYPYNNNRDFSEYGFLCYRIQEYLDGLDLEIKDVIDALDEDKQKALVEKARKVLKKIPDPNDVFHFERLDQNEALIKELMNEGGYSLSEAELRFLRHSNYARMDSFYKMRPLDSNLNVAISFHPVQYNESGNLNGSFELAFIDSVSRIKEDIKLYVDLQGLGFSDAFYFLNVIQIMKTINRVNIDIEAIIQNDFRTNGISYSIRNSWRQFRIQQLLDGITDFLTYGSCENVISILEGNAEETSPAEKHLIAGMKYVEEGIKFCNIPVLQYGVNVIRQALKSDVSKKGIAFLILKYLIERDYNHMLDGDEVSIPSLLEWTISKRMYQQALSIVESHIPTDMVKRGIFYYAQDAEDIENVKEAINICYWNDSPKVRYMYNDVDHYMLKSYGRNFIDNRQKPDKRTAALAGLSIRRIQEPIEGVLPAFTILDSGSMNLLYELLKAYFDIGDLRNQVCHSAAPENAFENGEELKPASNSEWISMSLSRFLKMYNNLCEKAGEAIANGKSYTPLTITDDEIHAYFKSHRLVPIEAPDNGTVSDSYICSFNGKEVSIRIKLFGPKE